jgi:hypothetical protein
LASDFSSGHTMNLNGKLNPKEADKRCEGEDRFVNALLLRFADLASPRDRTHSLA